MARTTTETAVGAVSPSLIRWGAVIGGVVVGMSLLILLTLMWFALAFENDMGQIAQNMAWFLGGSAIVAMLAGGVLAGWLSGVHGAGAGFFNGLTVWAIILIGSLALGVPGALNVMDPAAVTNGEFFADLGLAGNPIWATFISLVVGALAAGVGGIIGGLMTRPAVPIAPAVGLPPHEHRDGRVIDLRDEEVPVAAGETRTHATDRTERIDDRADVTRDDRADVTRDDVARDEPRTAVPTGRRMGPDDARTVERRSDAPPADSGQTDTRPMER
jgi:hypothetical protein